MSSENPVRPEVEELEKVAGWRLRLVDADPSDTVSAAAARLLETLAEDLRQEDHTSLWLELGSLSNWLSESGAISDYAELASDYRVRIGVSAVPTSGGDYLRGLLAIARSLL